MTGPVDWSVLAVLRGQQPAEKPPEQLPPGITPEVWAGLDPRLQTQMRANMNPSPAALPYPDAPGPGPTLNGQRVLTTAELVALTEASGIKVSPPNLADFLGDFDLSDVPEYLRQDVAIELCKQEAREKAKEIILRKDSGNVGNTWVRKEIVDTVSGVFDGTLKPPVPTLLQRSDNAYLFYVGMINSLFGSWGGGKTWVALILIVQMLATGQHVTYIDFEADEVSIIYRLKDLGATQNQIREYFHYIHPYAPVSDKEYVGLLAETHADKLIVIDSLGEWLAMHGKDSNSDQDVAAFSQKLLMRLVTSGAAVVFLDHTPNDDKNTQNLLRAIGSQRKMAAISGAAYRVGTIEPLARGQVGLLRLTSAKDRHGHWAKGQVVAEVVVDSTCDRIEYDVRPPKALNDAVQDELLLLVWSAGDDGIKTAEGLPIYVADRKQRDPSFMGTLADDAVRNAGMRVVRRKLSGWIDAKLVEHRNDDRWYLTTAGVELCENANPTNFADGEV